MQPEAQPVVIPVSVALAVLRLFQEAQARKKEAA